MSACQQPDMTEPPSARPTRRPDLWDGDEYEEQLMARDRHKGWTPPEGWSEWFRRQQGVTA